MKMNDSLICLNCDEIFPKIRKIKICNSFIKKFSMECPVCRTDEKTTFIKFVIDKDSMDTFKKVKEQGVWSKRQPCAA